MGIRDLREQMAALEENGQRMRVHERQMPEPDIRGFLRAACAMPVCPPTSRGADFMMCVRCYEDTAREVARAPDDSGAWVVYHCGRCNFSWRNTEEPEVIDPARRNLYFQLRGVDLTNLMHPCPIPPLKQG